MGGYEAETPGTARDESYLAYKRAQDAPLLQRDAENL
jgi:hypothetical protein